MRFFRTNNSSRPYNCKGSTVTFEPLYQMVGGSWVGVFATRDKALADRVAKHGPPIHEIGEEEYKELKKKETGINSGSYRRLSHPVDMRITAPSKDAADKGKAHAKVSQMSEEKLLTVGDLTQFMPRPVERIK